MDKCKEWTLKEIKNWLDDQEDGHSYGITPLENRIIIRRKE